MHGEKLRFVTAWESWIIFDGRRWNPEAATDVEACAKRVADQLWDEVGSERKKLNADAARDKALAKQIESFAKQSSSMKGIQNMIAAARSEPDVPIDHERLDTHPWLLNVLNGTIDLRSGTLRPHSPRDLLTQLCPVAYDPAAQCPRWLQFLREVTNENEELQAYLRRLVGYSLTGSTTEDALALLLGSGANGKNVLSATIMNLLGPDYAMRAAPDLLMDRACKQHPTGRADLFRKRLVVTTESDAGQLNESLVKDLTGGDRIRARGVNENFFEFASTHKLWMIGNHKPTIKGTDNGIWRRVQLIPFTRQFSPEEQDQDLEATLATELPGILNWALQGCLEWQESGLQPPAIVRAMTEEYRAEEDEIALFISDRCFLDAGAQVRAGDFLREYQRWAAETGRQAQSGKAIGRYLQQRFERRRSNGIVYVGIGLRSCLPLGRVPSALHQGGDAGGTERIGDNSI